MIIVFLIISYLKLSVFKVIELRQIVSYEIGATKMFSFNLKVIRR